MSLHMSSNRAAGGLVAAVVAAGGVAVSLGAGYTVAHATLSDGAAYVAKGHTVQHVNAEAREPDAKTPQPVGKGNDGLKVTALPHGQAAVVNQHTNTVTVIDGGTMTPTATVRRAGEKQPVTVVASGDRGYLVDHDDKTVTPLVDGKPTKAIAVAGQPLDAAPGPDNSVFVLDQRGDLRRVSEDRSVEQVHVQAGPGAALTRAGGHTYLVTTAGAVTQLDSGAPQTVATVDGLGPGPDGRMLVGALTSSGDHVLIVAQHLIGVVDLASGRGLPFDLHSGDDTLGRPVEYRSRIYVPDYTTHKVLVLDEDGTTLRLGTALDVPGDDPNFDLFISGGRLWANDQHSQHLLLVDASGTHSVDKGTGDGTHSERPQPNPKAPRRPTSRSNPTLPPMHTVPSAPTRAPTRAPVVRHPTRSTPPAHRAPSPPSVRKVPVPRIPAHTYYEDACAQIKAAGFQNCVAVSGASDLEGDSGDVTQVIPPSGGQPIPVTTTITVKYVGKPAVPDLEQQQTTPDEQCQAVQAAGLLCDPQPANQPGSSPDQFGYVASLTPAAGTQVDKGTTVHVYYVNSFPMPDENGQPAGQACDALGQLAIELPADKGGTQQVKCKFTEGTQPTKDPDQAGKTYTQQPAAQTKIGVSTPIKLTMYAGKFELPKWADMKDADGHGFKQENAQAYCGMYFRDCSTAPGDPAIGDHVGDAGRVQRTSPPAGKYAAGTQVQIIVYRGDNAVPDVTNQNPDQACATLASAGFQCNKLADTPNPNANVVSAQDPTGNQNIGTVVNIHYWAVQSVPLIEYVVTNSAGRQLHYLRVQGDPPPAGATPQRTVARVFPVNSTNNPNWQLKEFEWSKCGNRDIPTNVLYSHGQPDGCAKPYYTRSVADVLNPDAGNQNCLWGSVWIYRIGDGNDTYDVTIGTTPAQQPQPSAGGYTEPIGCVFPPG